jgi:hypothetical protein
MTEQEELRMLNEGLRGLQNTVNNIEEALIGGKFNELGVIHRVATIEKKLKRIDRAFYVLLGAVTLGAYPVGLRLSEILKPFINQYIR